VVEGNYQQDKTPLSQSHRASNKDPATQISDLLIKLSQIF